MPCLMEQIQAKAWVILMEEADTDVDKLLDYKEFSDMISKAQEVMKAEFKKKLWINVILGLI